jgi:hypothetical protein
MKPSRSAPRREYWMTWFASRGWTALLWDDTGDEFKTEPMEIEVEMTDSHEVRSIAVYRKSDETAVYIRNWAVVDGGE